MPYLTSHTHTHAHTHTHTQLAVAHAQQQNFASLVTQRTIEDFSPHAFELHVNRHNLVNGTLHQLVSTDERNYKKPLKVLPDSRKYCRSLYLAVASQVHLYTKIKVST